jgi:hypothetical protein
MPQSPTLYATDLLTKALLANPDTLLTLIRNVAAPLLEEGSMSARDLKTLQKKVMEVVRLRNNLAIMLDGLNVADPRQFDLFDDARPNDFA